MLSVGQLVAEKNRLEGVIEAAASAKKDIKALDAFLERFGGLSLPPLTTRTPGQFPCPDCEKSYVSKPSLQVHQEKVHGIARKAGDTKCPKCPAMLRGETGLRMHAARKHGGKK
jgi:uncharacterized C2H2 Zn-finger protein